MEDWCDGMYLVQNLHITSNMYRPTSASRPPAIPTCSISTVPTAQLFSATAVSPLSAVISSSLTVPSYIRRSSRPLDRRLHRQDQEQQHQVHQPREEGRRGMEEAHRRA